jgi:hypothetical protein
MGNTRNAGLVTRYSEMRHEFLQKARAKGPVVFVCGTATAFAVFLVTFDIGWDHFAHEAITSAKVIRSVVGSSVGGLIFGALTWYDFEKRPPKTKSVL